MKRRTKQKLKSVWRRGELPVFLLKKLLHFLHLSHFFSVQRRYYQARIFHDPFSFWLWTHPEKVREDEEFFAKFLKEGDVVIDGGTNVGTLTLTASKAVGNSGKVFSFEPHPQTFRYLEKNCKANGCKNVAFFNVALGKRHEKTFMIDEYVKDINHIDPKGSIPVEIVKLDDCKIDAEKVALLKLDVEGYELFALEGALDTLKKTTAVFFESSPKNFTRFGCELKDIINFLSQQGFFIYKINADWSLEKLDSSYVTRQKYENLLALKDIDLYTSRMGIQSV